MVPEMVSKVTCTNKAAAVAYFEKHLSTADYFIAADDQKQGVWIGKLSEMAGIEDEGIRREDFAKFLEGDLRSVGENFDRSPQMENLKRLRSSELLYTEFTYTAPKGFSIVAALDERLKTELFEAVKEEFKWFETAVSVRDRRGVNHALGDVTRPTGNFMAALFQHETSRANDPNMHVHGLIGNMSWDKERNELMAIHYGDMLELRKTLDARIHNNLAARCGELGYGVEVAKNGFGFKEVPREATEIFSRRHRQVEAAKRLGLEGFTPAQIAGTVAKLREKGLESAIENYAEMRRFAGSPAGNPMSALKAEETAVLATRPAKEEINADTLRENTVNRLADAGLHIRIPGERAPSIKPDLDADKVIAQAIKNGFSHESVIRLDELIGEAARLAPGAASNGELAKAIRDDPRVILGRMPTEERQAGVDLVTTAELVAQEQRILADVEAGFGYFEPNAEKPSYSPPPELRRDSERIGEILKQASERGEELSHEQVVTWLSQFAAIHEYVSTSTDQFLNIRGGAGVGKTFCMEMLVGDSLANGRNVLLAAPYGEQSRITMRSESARLSKAGKPEVADAFANANTVAHFLARAKSDAGFADSIRGADIFVDEAGLLDSQTAADIIRLAREKGARIIFQGDTEQKLAVGRGGPLVALQERLGLGMHVERASISRRQKRNEDKELARDLSSGDGKRFNNALDRFVERGDLREVEAEVAVDEAAKRVLQARGDGENLLAYSSVHRLGEEISEELHRRNIASNPKLKKTFIDSLKPLPLSEPELRSSHTYAPGLTVGFEHQGRIRTAEVLSVENGEVRIRQGRLKSRLNLSRVREVFERSGIERGVGEYLMLTEKIRQDGKTFERNSRHRIKRIGGGTLTFESGLKLPAKDGRLRQGDVLTIDKAQGAKGKSVLWVEDSRSLLAMGNRRDVHVGFTRHVDKLEVMVESIEIFRQTAGRKREKMSALGLSERPGKAIWEKIESRPSKTLLPSRILPRKRKAVTRALSANYRRVFQWARKLWPLGKSQGKIAT